MFKLSDRVRATMQHLLWEGWYYCLSDGGKEGDKDKDKNDNHDVYVSDNEDLQITNLV